MNSSSENKTFTFDKNLFVWGIIIFFTALILRLIFLFEFRSIPLFDTHIMDMKYFHDWAISFVGGSGAGPVPYFKAPLYPIFIGFVYSVFGDGQWAFRIVQSILGSFTAVLTFLISLRLFNKKVGITAGFITAFCSTLIIYDAQLLVPCLAIFLNMLGIYFLVVGIQTNKSLMFLFGGLFLGLSAIARPTILVFIIAAFIFLLWIYLKASNHLNKKSVLLFAIGVVLAITPVTIRNYVKSGEFVLIGTYGGINLYIGNNLQSDGISTRLPGTGLDWWGEGEMEEAIRIAEEDVGCKLNASEHSAYWRDKAIDEITANPGFFIKNMWRKLILFISGVELYNNFDIYYVAYQTTIMKLLLWKKFVFFPWGLLLPFAVAGIVLVRRWTSVKAIIVLFILSYIPTLLVFFVTSRYRLPMIPLLAMFASFFLVEGYKRLMGCSLFRRVTSIVILIGLLIVCQWDFYGLARGSDAQGHQMIASIYHYQGDDIKAEEFYRKALIADPDLPNANNDLGVFLMNKGNYEEAIELFEHAIKYEPGEYLFHLNLGDAYLNLDRIEEAIERYNHVLSLNSDSYNALYNLGQCWFNMNYPDSAIEYYNKAIALNSVLPDAYYSLGFVYHAIREIDSAQIYVSKAIENNPDYAQAYFSLGYIFMQQNEIDSAKTYFEKYLLLPTANDQYKSNVKYLLDSLQSK